MQKEPTTLQKNAPKIIVVVLLIAIAALLLVAGGSDVMTFFKGLGSANANDGNGNQLNQGGNTPIIPDDAGVTPAEPTDDTDDPGETPQEPVFTTVYPKAASTESERYAFTQTVAVEGNLTLKHVQNTAQGVFLVVEGRATGGDFATNRKTVSVIHMDAAGTLTGVLHLDTPYENEFLAAALTVFGLQVSVRSGDYIYLYHINPDLTHSAPLTLPAAKSVSLFDAEEGYIMICERAENTVYYIKNGTVAASVALLSGKTLTIQETAASFIFFINGMNGYNVIFMDKTLTSYETVTVPNKTLLCVQPSLENGKLVFLATEQVENSIYLGKYSSTYRANDNFAYLGIADRAETHMNGEGVMIVLEKAGTAKLYLADADLDVSLVSNKHLAQVTRIYGCYTYSFGYYILAAEGASLVFIDIRNTGDVSKRTIGEAAGYADFLRYASGDTVLFHTQTTETGAHIYINKSEA